MDLEKIALKEANELTPLEYADFMEQLESIPSYKAPLSGQEARLCFEFMEDTGLRVTETISVKKQDIDFRTRILTVTNPKSEHVCPCSKWEYADLRTRRRVLKYADKKCKKCHGKGKWKKPQRTTITPRLLKRLSDYCDKLKDDEVLFPVSRQSLWKWGKAAGDKANLKIFQQKEDRRFEGVFLHLFRAFCSKRMVVDAKDEPFRDQLIATKLRHAFNTVTDRYTKIDINTLLSWEQKTYAISEKVKDSWSKV